MSAVGIDWHHVLGPLLTNHQLFDTAELQQLEAATLSFARRAVRPAPGVSSDALPFETEPVAWHARGRFVSDRLDATGKPIRPGGFVHHAAGDYYIQDAASMLALTLCDVAPGQWVCDACAAPGGKSTALLEALAGQGLLLANEVIASRLAILNLALDRGGYANRLVMNCDIEQLAALCGSAFDCVLVDAPCTGQTMLARGKQSLAAFSPVQIEHSSARQLRIARAAMRLVKPGGRLVYSTCSFSFAENEQIVLTLQEQCPDWRLVSQPGLESWQSPLAAGCYRIWPHREGSAGAFAALLVRSESPRLESPEWNDARPQSSRWQRLESLPTDIAWFQERQPTGQWWANKRQLHRFDAAIPAAWIERANAGVCVAENKQTRWEPRFGSATLPQEVGQAPNALELEDSQAIAFVAGEALRCGKKEFDWCVVRWRGRPLGWGKVAAGVLKNHFPKPLRQTQLLAKPES